MNEKRNINLFSIMLHVLCILTIAGLILYNRATVRSARELKFEYETYYSELESRNRTLTEQLTEATILTTDLEQELTDIISNANRVSEHTETLTTDNRTTESILSQIREQRFDP